MTEHEFHFSPAILEDNRKRIVAASHLQFSQIGGRKPYLIVRKIPYVIPLSVCLEEAIQGADNYRQPSNPTQEQHPI